MNKLAFVFSSLMSVAIAAPAMALEVGDKAPEIHGGKWFNAKGTVSMAKLKGKIVVIDFWATWCGPCRAAHPEVVKIHEKYSKKGVVAIGLSDEKDETVAGFLEKHKTPYAIASGTTSARDYGIRAFPTFFVVNPAGKITYIGHDVHAARKSVEKCLKDTPPKSPEEMAKDRAAEAIKDLKEADKLYKNKELAEALVAYEAVVADYPKSPSAERAQAQVDKIKIEMAESEASEALTKANRMVDDKKYAQAMTAYTKVVEDYEGTAAAKTAATKLGKLRNDKTIGKEIREAEAAKKCKGWLQMARGLTKNGKPEAARKYYEKIIDQFGDTSFAVTAKEELAKL